MAYTDLWSILVSWKPEFTVKEFTSAFASPDPNKVLHDMAKKGFIEKISWGKYRVNSPKEYVSKRTNIPKAYELVNEAKRRYAFVGPDAVFFWTKGGYQADRFFGFYPIHMAVDEQELSEWKKFFHARKQKFAVEGKLLRETMFGLFYALHPRKRIKAENVEGTSVLPLRETVEFCKEHIFTYQPALEMLDEMYHLKLGVKYREEKTNF